MFDTEMLSQEMKPFSPDLQSDLILFCQDLYIERYTFSFIKNLKLSLK